jgi:hypothetical protein
MSDTRHPLPYYKGRYWLDNSIRTSWLECSRNFSYEWIETKVSSFSKVAQNYGKGIHLALAALSTKCGNDYSTANLTELDKVLDDHFDANPQPPDDHRQSSLAKETIHRYVKLYERESWTIRLANDRPFIERLLHAPFSEYNGIPIHFFGVVDLSVLASDRSDWVVDRKTTSMLGKNFDHDMQATGQMPGYCWLFKQCFDKLPQGYIVDAIRSLAPSEKAKADQKQLDKWWLEQFRRLPFFIDQDRVDEWELNTHRIVKRIITDFEDDVYPMNDKSCVGKYGRCQFFDICTLPVPQRLVALQSNNFIDNDWIQRTLADKV